MKNMNFATIIVIILVTGLAIAGITAYFSATKTVDQSNSTNEIVSVNNNTSANAVPSQPSNNTASEGEEPGVVEISMIAKKYTYEPSTIEVNKGDKVIIKVKSIDVPHSFTLEDFGTNEFGDPGINAILLPNEEVTIEFVADKTGEFPFGCDVVCGIGHVKMSMDGGKLIVN